MPKKLTDRALRFCQEYVKNGFNGCKAYQTVYGQEDKMIASVCATKLLKDQRVKDELNNIEGDYRNIGLREGLNKEEMVKILMAMMKAEKVISRKKGKDGEDIVEKAPDWQARLNAILAYTRLTGDLSEKKKIEITDGGEEEDGDDNFSEMSADELKAQREQMIKDMSIVSK